MKTLKIENARTQEHRTMRTIGFMVSWFYGFMMMLVPVISFAYQLEVGIPGQAARGATVKLPQYLEMVYNFALWGVGLAALAMLIWAGMQWIVSGLPDVKADAMEQIKSALTGLGLVLLSYLILQTINPKLVSITLPDVKTPGGSSEINVSRLPLYGCADLAGNSIGDTSPDPVSCPAPQILAAYIWNTSKNCFERSNKGGCAPIGGGSSSTAPPKKVYGCRDNNDQIIGKASQKAFFCPAGQTMIGIPWDPSTNCYTRPLRNECIEVAIGN